MVFVDFDVFIEDSVNDLVRKFDLVVLDVLGI